MTEECLKQVKVVLEVLRVVLVVLGVVLRVVLVVESYTAIANSLFLPSVRGRGVLTVGLSASCCPLVVMAEVVSVTQTDQLVSEH